MFTYVHIFLVFWDVLGRRRWQIQLSSLQWIPSEHPWLSFHVFRPREMSCFQTSSHKRVTVQTYLDITCDFYLRSDAICEKANVWHGMSIFSKFIFPAPKKMERLLSYSLEWIPGCLGICLEQCLPGLPVALALTTFPFAFSNASPPLQYTGDMDWWQLLSVYVLYIQYVYVTYVHVIIALNWLFGFYFRYTCADVVQITE